MLALTRRLLALRRSTPALAIGSYQPLDAAPQLFAWIRQCGSQRVLAAVNFADADVDLRLPGGGCLRLRTRAPSATPTPVDGAVTIGALEAVVIELRDGPHRRTRPSHETRCRPGPGRPNVTTTRTGIGVDELL